MSLADPHASGNYIVGVKRSIVGSKVINEAREYLGKIEDVIIDTRTDQVAYVILSFGGVMGIGDKHFAVPWKAIHYAPGEQCAVLNIDKDRLRNAPGFDKGNWPDMADPEFANRIREHYSGQAGAKGQAHRSGTSR